MTIYKNQKIPLNVPKGTPRMICVLHIGRRGQVVEPERAVTLHSLNQGRGSEILFCVLITGSVKKGCPQAKSREEERRQ